MGPTALGGRSRACAERRPQHGQRPVGTGAVWEQQGRWETLSPSREPRGAWESFPSGDNVSQGSVRTEELFR